MSPWVRIAVLDGASVGAFLLVHAVACWIEQRHRSRRQAPGPVVRAALEQTLGP